jgi:predicted NBD/HSP70 family sugar kinase
VRTVKSPADLGADIQRYLEHKPISAGPASVAYRTRKFAARYRWWVTVAAICTFGISVGIPAPVVDGLVVREPVNLGEGWNGFDFETAFGKPTKLINDAAMQALGSYDGGRMLFLGLGTGLGTTLIIDGFVVPMEVQHMPFRKSTFEDYVGERGLERLGVKRWRKALLEVIDVYVAAFSPDYVVLGGGNARVLGELPANCRLGHNEDAFLGGFRLWVDLRPD